MIRGVFVAAVCAGLVWTAPATGAFMDGDKLLAKCNGGPRRGTGRVRGLRRRHRRRPVDGLGARAPGLHVTFRDDRTGGRRREAVAGNPPR